MMAQTIGALRPSHHVYTERRWAMLLRWSLAGLCVACLHGALAYAALSWPRDAASIAEPPAAVMIDLAPVPTAPQTPPDNVALGPQMEMSEAAMPSEMEEKAEQVAELKPEVKTEVEIPPLPEKKNAEAVLAQPTPPQPSKQKPQDKPREKQKKVQKLPQNRKSADAPATAAPQASDARLAATNAAPVAGTSSSVSPANWRSMIMALFNRHKRTPSGGGRGTSHVLFAIDRSGRVLSARLAGSSGSAELDREAVSLAHRVSPLPPPPHDVVGGTVTLTVPVRFSQ